MTKWFYSVDGQVHGPVEQKEIEELLQSKKIAFEERVYRDGDVKWRPAFEFEEFERLFSKINVKNEVQWVVLFKKPKEKGRGYTQKGPFTTEEIKNQIKNGQIKYSNYIWKEGMEKWLKVSDVDEFNGSPKVTYQKQKPETSSEPPALPEYTKTEVSLKGEDSEEFSFEKLSSLEKKHDEKINNGSFDEQTQTVELSVETDEFTSLMDDSVTKVVGTNESQQDKLRNKAEVFDENDFERTRVANVSYRKPKNKFNDDSKASNSDKPPRLNVVNKNVSKGKSAAESKEASDFSDDLDKTVVDTNTAKKIIEEFRNIKSKNNQEDTAVLKNIEYIDETPVDDSVRVHKNIVDETDLSKRKKSRSKRRKSKKQEKSDSDEKIKLPSFRDALEFFTQSNILTGLLIAFFSSGLLAIFIFIGADILKNKGYEVPFFNFNEENEEEESGEENTRYKIPPPKESFKQQQAKTTRPDAVKPVAANPNQRQNVNLQNNMKEPVVTKAVEVEKPKTPAPKPKKEPTYFKIQTKNWNTSKAEILVQTDGTDDYLFVMDVVGRFGDILGRKNYFDKKYFRKDRSILVSQLNLEPGEYKIIFKYKDVESSKAVFWGKKNKQFKVDMWKFKKRNVFDHHQERAKLIYATTKMSSILNKLIDNNQEKNRRRWWKTYGKLKRQWSAAGKSQLNSLTYKKASKYVHFFFWQQLKEVKGQVSELLTEISKSSDKNTHPNNAQLKVLLGQLKGFEQKSKKLTIW